ncbi:MAG TPA: hypothetical protein VMJ32_00825 [Pirellulales bacterium]|nr:hypothetical protein [Pirellulales bacterium]
MSDAPSNLPNLDQLDEQLVAYLDGELEPQAARQIENTLATDERARKRLNQLASSWDLLDQLPRATVDDLFTRTTVEMVALAAEDEVAQDRVGDPAKRRRRWLEGGIATLAAAVVGFVVVAMVMPDQNDALLRDLPVVKNLELYQDVGDIELLKQLQKANLFAEDANSFLANKTSANEAHIAPSIINIPPLIPASLQERRAWVESQSPADKVALRDEFEKFSALPVKQQQSLREFDEQLSSDQDNAQLRRIMQRYYDWLKTLTSTDRATVLEEADPLERVKSINNLKQREMQQAFALLDPGQIILKDRDSAAVLRWMRDFAENHEVELTSAQADSKRPDSQKSDERRRRRPLAGIAWQEWWSPTATGTPPVTPADIHSLHALLSSEKQEELDAETGLTAQVQLIRQWIQRASSELREFEMQAFGRGGPPQNFGRLRQYEEQMPADEKKELEGLSGAERWRKLMELYQKHRSADVQRPSGSTPRQSNDSAAPGAAKSDDRE